MARASLLRLGFLGLVCSLVHCSGQSPSPGDSPNGPGGGGPDLPPGTVAPAGDGEFESDDPSAQAQGARGQATAGADANAAPPSASKDEAQRAIEEADVIKQSGTRLYALSRYGGLSVIDLSVQDQIRLIGRYRMDAMPFEMYVRGNTVYAMVNGFGKYNYDAATRLGTWVQTSEMLALDTTNPASIQLTASYDLPGEISDSRLVGDALYVVTYENGYCWNCQTNPATVVTSFHVAANAFTKKDQKSFTSPNRTYSWWKRSVSATNQRLYIAGPEWNWTQGNTQDNHSIVQVVDISDPTGSLVQGAQVTVDGQITSRWQMDEYDGVLRVISQKNNNGWGGGTTDPVVQTFRITSSQQITALGRTSIHLPRPESLRSTRFDGTRGYAITVERQDPLFTIDLTDPANPVQKGELEMPGWIYHMEPRGDRLVALGFDNVTWSGGALNVTLFDVSNLAAPSIKKRVSFAHGYSQLAEDQDRIHKSFQVLDDQGLILIPFANYGGWDGTTCRQAQSGIQLVDMTRDDLVLRGVAPQRGEPRRAFIYNQRLFAMSDRNVTSFRFDNRDQPVKAAEIDLSNPAYRIVSVGDHIAQLTNDWWSSEPMLTLTPKANADNAAITGRVSLASIAPPSPNNCGYWGSYWYAWYGARLFADRDYVHVAVPLYSYDRGTYQSQVIFVTVDVSNRAAPRILGSFSIPFGDNGYYGFYDGYAYSSMWGWSIPAAGSAIAQRGSTLSLLETKRTSNDYRDSTVSRKLHVLDFSNAAAPRRQIVDLGLSLGSTPLVMNDLQVLTSRWNQVANRPGRVRFFVDRVDISNPATPRVLPSINTPGTLLLADSSVNRYVNVDYARTVTPAATWEDCYNGGYSRAAFFDYPTQTCIRVQRSFKLLQIANDRATLLHTMTPPSQNVGGIQTASDRIYVTMYPEYVYARTSSVDSYSPPQVRPGSQYGLFVYTGIKSGQLREHGVLRGEAQWPLAVQGNRVAVLKNGGVGIYDTTITGAPIQVGGSDLRGYGYSTDMLLEHDKAVCALGEWGLQTISLQ